MMIAGMPIFGWIGLACGIGMFACLVLGLCAGAKRGDEQIETAVAIREERRALARATGYSSGRLVSDDRRADLIVAGDGFDPDGDYWSDR